MDRENPQRLSVATRKHAYDELEANSDGEAFDFSKVDAMLDLDLSDAEEPVQAKIVSDIKPT